MLHTPSALYASMLAQQLPLDIPQHTIFTLHYAPVYTCMFVKLPPLPKVSAMLCYLSIHPSINPSPFQVIVMGPVVQTGSPQAACRLVATLHHP